MVFESIEGLQEKLLKASNLRLMAFPALELGAEERVLVLSEGIEGASLAPGFYSFWPTAPGTVTQLEFCPHRD